MFKKIKFYSNMLRFMYIYHNISMNSSYKDKCFGQKL